MDLSILGCIAPEIADQMPWFMPILAVATGAVFGSYLTCALYRTPLRLSLWRPPSYCPSCKNTLRMRDLVPVLSWVYYRGRCGQCKAPISPRYLLVEALSITIAVFALKASGGGFSYLLGYGFAVSMGAAAYFLLKHRQLPLKSVAFGLLCLGLYVAFQQPLFACGAAIY